MMDTFGGVMVSPQDELTVQSLLSLPESTAMGLSGELMAQAAFIQGPPTEITLDEDDVFQCGKCKKVFTSFQLFMFHKKKHQLPGLALSLDEDLDGAAITERLVPQHPDESAQSQNDKQPPSALHFTALEDNSFGALPSDIGQPILLADQDPLSFSIDEGVLSINAAQLPEGSFVSSSLNTLPSVSEAMKSHEGTTTDTTTTWLLTKQDDNLNLVATTYADERTLFLNEGQKSVVDINSDKSGDKVHADLEFTSDALLSEVPFASEKEVFLDGSSITVQETITGDTEPRVILPSGEYMLKSGIDYINSGELLTGFEKVDEQILVPEEQSNHAVSANVLEVEMPSIQNNLAMSAKSLESTPLNDFSDESPSPEPQKKRRPKTKKTKGAKSNYILTGQKLKCAFCSKRFSKNFDLQQHQRSHTGEKPFQCVVCGRAFAQKSNVKKHMRTHKVWPKSIETLPKVIVQEVQQVQQTKSSEESNDKTDDTEVSDEATPAKKGPEYVIDNSYTCQYCDASHDSYYALKKHLSTHLSQKVYWCNQSGCLKTFPDLDTFLEHTQIHISREASYRCHVCKLTFKNLSDLGIHQYTHSAKEKPVLKSLGDKYTCQKCRSRFNSPENLEHHMFTASHYHPCPECKRVFACERNLRRHLIAHSTSFPYSCKECQKNFKTEKSLKFHTLSHSDEKPFACKHCPAAFNRKDRLARHQLIHDPVKKFKCPFHTHLNCDREFNRQDKLKLHILTHLTHVKEHQCKYCKKAFKKVLVLRKHERKCPRRVEHRKTFKRKTDSPTEGISETSQENSSETPPPENSHPQSPNSEDYLPKKDPRYIVTTKQVAAKTITFKVGPSKSQTSRKRKSLTETASSEASLQTPNTSNDNVPTIEIIVMPLSLNVRTEGMDDPMEGGVHNETGIYRVMFPADNSEYPIDLTTFDDVPLLSRLDFEKNGGVTLVSSTDQAVAVYPANAGIQKL